MFSRTTVLAVAAVLVSSSLAQAGFTVTRETHTDIPNLPKMATMFMKDGPIIQVESVDGNLKATVQGEGKKQVVTLVELFKNAEGQDDARVYTIKKGGKSCQVLTREQFEQTQAIFGEDSPFKMGRTQEEPPENADEYEFESDCKDTNEMLDAKGRQVPETKCTMTVKKKGQTLEEGGGMRIETSMGFAKMPGHQELLDFDKRYAEIMVNAMGFGDEYRGLSKFFGGMPGLRENMSLLEEKIIGKEMATVVTNVTMWQYGDPSAWGGAGAEASMKAEASEDEDDGGRPSLGKFASKFMKKRKAKKDAKKAKKAAETNADGGRKVVSVKSYMYDDKQQASYTTIPDRCREKVKDLEK